MKVYGKIINSPDEPFIVWVSAYIPPVLWEFIFEDPIRGTILRISTDDNYFQFVTSDKTFSKIEAQTMIADGQLICIWHRDNEIQLVASAVSTLDYCKATAWDQQTLKLYLLLDPVGTE